MRLDACLGLVPGRGCTPWWESESCAERDQIDWVLLGSLVMGSLPGIFFGSHLGARVPDKVLRPVLAKILVIVGVRMLRA